MLYLELFGAMSLGNLMTLHNPSHRKVLYWSLLIFLFCFVTFRWDVGCDFETYATISQQGSYLQVDDVLEKKEAGFWLLIIGLYRLGWAYPTLNVFGALAFFSGFHAMARRQPDPLLFLTLAFPVLIIQMPMSAMRQGVAIGFMCFAFNAFLDRRLLSFGFWVAAASSFHASAFAFVMLVPFMVKMELKRRFVVSSILALPIAYYVVNTDTAESYSVYSKLAIDAFGGSSRAALLFLTGAAYFLFIRAEWKKQSPHDYDLVTIVAPMLLLILPLTYFQSALADRFGYYFLPVELMIQSRAYMFYRNSFMIPLLGAPLAAGLFVLLIWTFFSWIAGVCFLNYTTWWQIGTFTPGPFSGS